MVFCWAILNVLGPFHLMNLVIIIYLLILISAFWFLLECYHYITNQPNAFTDKGQVFPFIIIALLLHMTFIMLKIMHWPFGGIIHFFSSIIFPIAFFFEYKWLKLKSQPNF